MTTWEVALCNSEASRYVLVAGVPTEQLHAFISEALVEPHPFGIKPAAVMVTRMDATPEALRSKWEADFYDLDKRGHKRRRYRAPQIERDWIKMIERDKKEARAHAQAQNIHQGKETF